MNARKRVTICLGAVALCLAFAVPSAQAGFGIKAFSVKAVNEDGTPDTLAGSHPYEYTLHFEMNQDSEKSPEGTLRRLIVDLPPGFLGNPQALPRCTRAQFDFNTASTCPGNTQVGVADLEANRSGLFIHPGVYNLVPTPGSPATLGVVIDNNNAYQEASLRSASDYGVRISDLAVPTREEIQRVSVHVWGLPQASVHYPERFCIPTDPEEGQITGCESDAPPAPFLTMPTACNGPLKTTLKVESVEEPGVLREASVLSEDENEEPVGLEGCNQLQFEPSISSQPTTNLADSPSGLDFNLHQVTEADFEPQPGEGEHKAGQTEICQAGTWAEEPSEFAYQWLRNGVPIPGAEAKQYVVQGADAGTGLQCEVTATNAGGDGIALSAPAVVSPAPATPPPGGKVNNAGLTEPTGQPGFAGGDGCDPNPNGWSGSPSFSFQWFKDGAPVPGETGATFLSPLTPPYTLQCEVFATNAGGTVGAFASVGGASQSVVSTPQPDPALPDNIFRPGFGVAQGGLPRASAPARDVTVTLPEGMSVNPSAANGLAACSESQIGYLSGVPGVHFSEAPQSCPNASKVGSLEVSSPLLDHKIKDGEGGARAAVYVAKPFDNPFGSLLAIYLTVEDPQTGIIAKLAGKAEPDPKTGQLKTTFKENPQLPIEDFALHLFEGPEATLKTPLACGTHTTSSEMVPWSSPEGANASPSDSFVTSVAAGGSGPCPTSEAQAPNKPSFTAGTVAVQAGAYSPFVLKLSRPDGSQRLTGIDTTLPPGLTGKLAGIPYCSEAAIAQAKSREAPSKGALEQQSPSCPSSSEVGTVTAGAGAGISPFYATGHAYLAGPYKGAPLSLVVIAPAVAGPFDLGAVVVRTALYVNPETARIHAVSDPLPSIIDGIPLDLRSISLTLGRPSFTLNPTNCDPLSITGSALALTGQSAALASPFQVGGCVALPFKPNLSLKLKGGTKRGDHPALTATLRAKPGEANTASVSVSLPHSEFLDQAHIKTICTRVQFSAGAVPGAACPKGSIYGEATAITPLLDQPLTGPVFLRSSNHNLPDLVIALHGQVDVVVDGRIDSHKGGIRNTIEAAPDAPVTRFTLSMQGGKKGLLINSRDICRSKARATVQMVGQNGKANDFTPAVRNEKCGGRAKKQGKSGPRG
jgi:hypothetical protein